MYNNTEVRAVVVYLDVLFFYNFIINTLLLYASGYVLKIKIRWIRLVLGGCFGAFYGIFSVICYIHPVINAGLKLLCAFVMVYISYRQSPRGYIRLLCTLFISSFCLCGLYMAFASFSKLEGSEDALFLNLGYPYIFLVFLLFLFLLNLYIEGVYVKVRKRELFKTVEIENGGKRVKLSGYVDTGNTLTTPEGFPVAFVNSKYTKGIVKEELCVLEYTTISGGAKGQGFIPEKLLIDGKEVKYAVVPVDEDFENNFDILLGGIECLDL